VRFRSVYFVVDVFQGTKQGGKKQMDLNWSILILIAGILATFLSQLNVFGKGNRKSGTWIGLIVAVFGIIVVAGILPITALNSPISFGNLAVTGGDQSDSGSVSSGFCGVEDTTVTLSAMDKYLSTVTGGSHRYRVSGSPALTVADAGTLTASPGDKLEVLWANGTNTGYYSSVDSFIVPCKGTFTPDAKTLAQNGTLSVTFFNDPNNQPINAVTNQSLVAGDVKNVKAVVQGQYQKEFPYGFDVVVEYNKTAIDDVTLSSNGAELQSVAVPQTHSASFSTESSRKAYRMPEAISNKEYDYTVVVDTDDSVDPLPLQGDVKFSFFPRNYFINDKNGGAYEGPSAEDEYATVTRSGQISATLYVQ
jgi:hypothetical protein